MLPMIDEFSGRLMTTFAHFLWQGTLAALLLACVLRCLRASAPGARYLAAVACLILMAAAVPVTYVSLVPGRVEEVAVQQRFREGPAAQTLSTATRLGAAQPSHPGVLRSENRPRNPATVAPQDNPGAAPSADTRRTALLLPSSVVLALTWAYFIVAAVLFSRLAVGIAGAARLRRLSEPVRDWHSRSTMARLAEQLGLRTTPLVAWSCRITVPTVAGVVRPSVLLPLSCATGLSPAQLEQILMHEFIHLRRYDHVVNLLQKLIEAALFFHPAVWWVSRRVRLERELCCDAAVVGLGCSPSEYATSLLKAAALACHERPTSRVGVMGVHALGEPPQLRVRISRLMGVPASPAVRVSERAIVLIVLLSMLGVGGIALRSAAQTGDQDRANPTQTDPGDPTDEASGEEGSPSDRDTEQPTADVEPNELVGQVVDRDGRPIEGVLVDAWTWYTGHEATTDADGRFKLTDLDPKRRAEVLVTKDGYSPAYFPTQAPGVADFVVTLGDQTYLEGVVRDADGRPVPGAEILAKFGPVQADGVQISNVTTKTGADEQGRYRLYVKPDTYDVQVIGGAAGVARLTGVFINEDEAKNLDITLQPGVRFEANVVDSITGRPVEGFVLFTWRDPIVSAKSNEQGRILIEGLLPGELEFQCGGGEPRTMRGMTFYQHGPFGRWWSPQAVHEVQRKHFDEHRGGWQRNFDSLTFDLAVGMDPVTIEVEQGVTVTGRVTDPDGNPVEKATVAPARTGSGNSITGDTRYSVQTEEDGTYRVVLPASGNVEYNFVAHDGEYGQWRNWANAVSEPMRTEPGQTLENLDFRLQRPATVRGKVLLEGRVAGPRDVRAHAADKRGNRYYDPKTTINEDGTFELKFIRPGKHYIQVEPFWLDAEQAPEGTSVTVDLGEGEVVEGVELRAKPSAEPINPALAARTFTVRVVDAEGQPVAGTAVGLASESLLGALHEDPGERRLTAEDGRVTLPKGLFAQQQLGTWVYVVDHEQDRVGMAKLFADLADPEVEVQLHPTSRVTIVPRSPELEELGISLESVHVHIVRDGLYLMSGVTEEGSREYLEFLLPPGEYFVHLSGTDVEGTKVKLIIEPGQDVVLQEIELKPARLTQLYGQPAPELRQIKGWHNGEAARLADLRGKVVVLDFWGYWCGPCLATMPNLMDLYDRFAEQDVVFLAIHDDSIGSIDALLEQLNDIKAVHWGGRDLPFLIALDGGGMTPIPGTENLSTRGATTAAYGITAFPTTLLIDRDGNVARRLNPVDVDAAQRQIEELLE